MVMFVCGIVLTLSTTMEPFDLGGADELVALTIINLTGVDTDEASVIVVPAFGRVTTIGAFGVMLYEKFNNWGIVLVIWVVVVISVLVEIIDGDVPGRPPPEFIIPPL